MELLPQLPDVIRRTGPLLLALSLAATNVAYAADAEWLLAQDDGRIQIFTRPVTDSPFLEVKATALINASIAQVAADMGDGQGCGEWRIMCKSSQELSTASGKTVDV